jgi:uncharacterized membrane protein YiaA
VLELFNFNLNEMKNSKKVLLLIIAGTLTYVAGIFAYATMAEIKLIEYIIFIAVGLAAIIGIIIALRNVKTEQQGFQTEDELSSRIKDKTGAKSFIASIYLWTMIFVFTYDSNLHTEIVLGIGLAGMFIIYVVFWLLQKSKGVIDEN